MTDPAIKRLYNRCKPDVPVPAEDPEGWYVDFDADDLRGSPCITRLAQVIAMNEEPTAQLFTGFSGSGKSSELLRLRQRLEQRGYFVVLADAEHTVDPTTPIEYVEVVIALGLAVDEALDGAGQGPGRALRWAQRFGREVGELFAADVELGSVGAKPKVAELGGQIGIELRHNPSFRGELRKAANARRREFLDQAAAFFAAADAEVREAGWAGGLVVLLDNLEKLSGEAKVRESAAATFLHHADALRRPPIHLVYTIPPALVFASEGPQLGRLYSGEPLVLPMVKLRGGEAGQPSPGLTRLRELVECRVGGSGIFADDALLDRIVETSGGYPRDLLRLVQYALLEAEALPLGAGAVDRACAFLRLSYQRSLSTDDLELLTHIRDERPTIIPEALRPRLESVIVNHFAMIYANAKQWYDIHPLVSTLLDELGPGSPRAPK